MSNIQLKNDIAHFSVEKDNENKMIVEVSFDISAFQTEQEVYDFFGEKIYGNNREYLNNIFVDTKVFGGNLSSFYDCFTSYLIGIHLDKRNEILSIKITNKFDKSMSEFWLSLLAILMNIFFGRYQDVCDYADFFELRISKDILNETLNHFLFLLSNQVNKPIDLLDENGCYL